ncbi:MAG: DUF4174 domain-containing protein [Pseudomonadota bacterium]
MTVRRRFTLSILLAALTWPGAMLLAQSPSNVPTLAALSQLRWEYRVLLVFDEAPARDDTALLREQATAFRERDTLWFVVRDGEVQSNYPGPLAEGFGERGLRGLARGERVVLIGKDGGVKLRTSSLDIAGVFALIDGMPMRRREMRERGSEGKR